MDSADADLQKTIAEIQDLHTQASLIADVAKKMLDAYTSEDASEAKAA